jgi:hypothetical protein
MARLLLTEGPGVSRGPVAFELAKGETELGRDRDNDLVIDDFAVSRRHAVVRRLPDGFWIEDQGSANGTSVGGVPVDRQLLRHGDRVEVGQSVLVFEDAGAAVLAGRTSGAVAAPSSPPQPDPASRQVMPSPGPTGPLAGIACSRCGRVTPPGNRFCIGCGAPLGSPTAPPPLTPAVPARPAGTPRPPPAWPLVVGLFALAAICGGVVAGVLVTRRMTVANPSVAAAARQFQVAAREDLPAAAQHCSTPSVRQRLDAIAAVAFAGTAPQAGWRQVLTACLVREGRPARGVHLVAFYNPWSDVALLTVWVTASPGAPKMVDVELLTGMFLRRQAQTEAAPAWLRADADPARVAASLATGWEEAFGRTVRGPAWWRSSWRAVLPGLDQQGLLDAAARAAGVQVGRVLEPLTRPADPGALEPRDARLRERLLSALDQLCQGSRAELLVEASATAPEVARLVMDTSGDEWCGFHAVGLARGSRSWVLLLAPGELHGRFAAIEAVDLGDRARVEKIEVLSLPDLPADIRP